MRQYQEYIALLFDADHAAISAHAKAIHAEIEGRCWLLQRRFTMPLQIRDRLQPLLEAQRAFVHASLAVEETRKAFEQLGVSLSNYDYQPPRD